jgi:Tol biopolymer transport system component
MSRLGFVLVSVLGSVCAPLLAQTTTRVSVDSSGGQADGNSGNFVKSVFTSSDGRLVLFVSFATNLVPGDTNGVIDVFLRDLVNGTTTRVSVGANGQGNAGSDYPSITPDHRFVAFESTSSNLAPGDPNLLSDVFVRDLMSGTTTLVSVNSNGVQGDNASFQPTISADGRYIAFVSTATNLAPPDQNDSPDVFVRDMVNRTTTRVSVGSNGQEGNDFSGIVCPAISADGRYVVFWSDASNLVPGDTNGKRDIFVRDLVASTTTRVSVDSNGTQGDGYCFNPTISADGRWVAFESDSTNLVPGDTNGARDVFVHDRTTGATMRVSVASNGTQGNGDSTNPSLSVDGRFVAYESVASNLVPGDTNGIADVFVHDTLTGTTTRLSVSSAGAQSDGSSHVPSISSDGRRVAFFSAATNLVPGDTNAKVDVFVRDLGAASAFVPLCFGDGASAPCPCGNVGLPGHGCENSSTTGGARLSSSGVASLSSDTVRLDSTGELPTALSIVLQGSSVVAPVDFGDGLRCAGGALDRLYVKHAIGGVVAVPQSGDPSISTRSATLGHPIPLGATRAYQVYYRDPNLAFCPGGFNVSGAIAIAWGS